MDSSFNGTDQKYRVLILDDDILLGELIREFLQATKTCSVKYISAETDLWGCLDEENFDILFLDYKLPGTTGLEILTQINEKGILLPTVMMTGEGSENIAVRAIQAGALDYLVKGDFSFSVLPSLVQRAVRHKEIQLSMQHYMDQVRYQSLLLDNMRDAVVVWDLDGVISYWNSAAEGLFAARSTTRIGEKVVEVFFPNFIPTVVQLAQTGEDHRPVEFQYRLPSGGIIWISAQVTSLFRENGGAIGTMVVSRDITPLKHEQEELVKSQLFIKRILDASPNIIYTLDLNTRQFSYISAEVKTILGYELEEYQHATSDQVFSHVHPEDTPRLAAHFQEMTRLKEGETVDFEFRILGQGRQWHWLKSRETIFTTDSTGAPVEIIGVVQDITASKQSEEELRASEARYRAIVEEHQTEMICRFLPDGELTFVNEAYCRYNGQDRTELVGTSFMAAFLEEYQTAAIETITQLTCPSPETTLELQVQTSDGQIRWQEWVVRAIFDLSHQFIEFQGVGRDITDRKKMIETIQAAQTRLAQTARMVSIGELASGVAHQISNPLTTIIAEAQMLSRELEKDHPGHESTEAIMAAGWRAQSVINELMKFSQPAMARIEMTSINETINDALLLTSSHLLAFGINLEVNLSSGLPDISANPRQLTDLWVNLLLLARSAITPYTGNTIHIHTRLNEQECVEVCFTDNGRSIPPALRERIFEPQLIPAASGRGNGIELSICHEIVRQNCGSIALAGSDQETTFTITFNPRGIQ
jgi:PAS domain S-box-containing protein